MKIAIVVQRYGAEINGGAELHARYIAEHLARHVSVEVLTTCARDYITWANDYPPGEASAGPITVRRFPVSQPRDPRTFGSWSERVFGARHSVNDELAWLDAEGPTSPALVRYVADHQAEFEFVLFFSFRYYHAYHGARAVPGKAILVPTAERDEALGLSIFRPLLGAVRGLMYNSPEERTLLQAVAGTDAVPGVVVGVGSEVPAATSAARFRQRTGLQERTAIYIGRIDENKGCVELFDFWKRYAEITPGGLTLVLIGTPVLPIPQHPRIRHLGFVSDEEKYDALAAAEFLIMPSYFESLSMVALEAWALGKPVLANGKCDVLRGQAVRSNGGLYYENYGEFAEAVRVLDGTPHVASTLGQNGSRYFRTHYAWPVIERKYLDMFERLSKQDAGEVARRQAPQLPGWWGRRQKTLPPAREVLQGLPSGPVLGREPRDTAARDTREVNDGRDLRQARDVRDVRDTRHARPPRPAASVPPPAPSAGASPAPGRPQRRDDSRQRGRDGRPQRPAQTGAKPATTAPGTPRPSGGAAPPSGEPQAPSGQRGRQRRGRRPGGRPARKGEA